MSADRHNMSHGKQKYMQLCCTPRDPISTNREARFSLVMRQLNGSVKEPNMFHNYETDKITRKANDTAVCLAASAPTNNSSYIGRVISFYFVFVFVFVFVYDH